MISIELIGSNFLSYQMSHEMCSKMSITCEKQVWCPKYSKFGTGAERHLLESDRKPRAEKELSHAMHSWRIGMRWKEFLICLNKNTPYFMLHTLSNAYSGHWSMYFCSLQNNEKKKKKTIQTKTKTSSKCNNGFCGRSCMCVCGVCASSSELFVAVCCLRRSHSICVRDEKYS